MAVAAPVVYLIVAFLLISATPRFFTEREIVPDFWRCQVLRFANQHRSLVEGLLQFREDFNRAPGKGKMVSTNLRFTRVDT